MVGLVFDFGYFFLDGKIQRGISNERLQLCRNYVVENDTGFVTG